MTSALITGANRGIGLEIARQLAERNVSVLIGGRNNDAIEEQSLAFKKAGLDASPCLLDVTNQSSIQRASAEVELRFGSLDILINNAAIRIEQYGKQPSEQPIQQWRETFETNLLGAVSVTQAFLPLILRSEAGRIVNVSSLLGSVTTQNDPTSYAYSPMFKSLPAYSASKSALNSWTVHLAYELRNTGIKVNSVHPGYTKTDLNDGDGDLDVSTGARTSVDLAMSGPDGHTGTFVHLGTNLPW